MKLATWSLLIATNLAVLTNLPAHAASFSFSPVGTQLDGDTPNDLIVTPGQQISFATTITTAGLPGNLYNFSYQIVYDTSELEYVGAGRGLLDRTLFRRNINPNQGGDGSTFDRMTRTATGVPGSPSILLDTISFNVLNPVNDGLPDFEVSVLSANTTSFQDVTALFSTNQNISLQPVPEPLTLTGVGVAIGLGTFFKRKNTRKGSNSN